jgi:hypothetical protein
MSKDVWLQNMTWEEVQQGVKESRGTIILPIGSTEQHGAHLPVGTDTMVASVFPGFHDIYQEAGVGPSYGYLDAQDGKTFEPTFQKALERDADIIQVVTWNDYGEGTNIEPTLEYGTQYLEMVQRIRQEIVDEESTYTSEDLEVPFQIYQLRKQHRLDSQVNQQLDQAVLAVLAGKTEFAREILNNLPIE